MLEPIVMKVTRWVLRREGGGDPSDLSDVRGLSFVNCKGKQKHFPSNINNEQINESIAPVQKTPSQLYSGSVKAHILQYPIVFLTGCK